MQQREKIDGLGAVIDKIRNGKVLRQCIDAHLVCMCSWLHGREWWNTQSPSPGDGWGLLWNLIFWPKPVDSTDYMRAVPGRNGGASKIRASAQVLGMVRRHGPVREGVDVRQVYGVVTADAAVVLVEGFMHGRERRGVKAGWTSLKEERLSGRHRLVEIEVAVQLVETSRRREIGGSHQSRGRRDRG